MAILIRHKCGERKNTVGHRCFKPSSYFFCKDFKMREMEAYIFRLGLVFGFTPFTFNSHGKIRFKWKSPQVGSSKES